MALGRDHSRRSYLPPDVRRRLLDCVRQARAQLSPCRIGLPCHEKVAVQLDPDMDDDRLMGYVELLCASSLN